MKNGRFSKIAKVVMCVALATMMCFGMATMALADTAKGTPGTNSENPAKAAITKVLHTGLETRLAGNMTFNFAFEQKTDVTQDSTGTAITIAPYTVPIKDVSAIVTTTMTGSTDGDQKTYEVQTSNFLEKAADNANYEHAGIYVYDVTETASVSAIAGVTLAKQGITNEYKSADGKNTLYFSSATYRVYVYVANDTRTGHTNEVYVKNVGIVLTKGDDVPGTPGTPSTEKIDGTPGQPGTTGEIMASNSDMIFTNVYAKKLGGDTPDPANQALEINKTVAGSYGDQNKYFEFNVKLERPTFFADATMTYKGYVVDASNAVVTSTDNVPTANAGLVKTDANNKKYIEFTGKEANGVDILLKHGQRLVFADTCVGVKFTATEKVVTGYTPKIDLTIAGAVITPSIETVTGTAPNQTITTTQKTVGENKNVAAFTNTFGDPTPTGILMNNLPYIMLIVVALGSLAAFAIVRSRKRATAGSRH